MTMKTMIAAGALALSLIAGAAAAQTPGETESQRDLTCTAFFLAIADSLDPATVQAGTLGALFFYGRLEGREPGVNWFERLAVYLDQVDRQQLMGRAQECSAIIERVGQGMIAYAEEYEAAQ